MLHMKDACQVSNKATKNYQLNIGKEMTNGLSNPMVSITKDSSFWIGGWALYGIFLIKFLGLCR